MTHNTIGEQARLIVAQAKSRREANLKATAENIRPELRSKAHQCIPAIKDRILDASKSESTYIVYQVNSSWPDPLFVGYSNLHLEVFIEELTKILEFQDLSVERDRGDRLKISWK